MNARSTPQIQAIIARAEKSLQEARGRKDRPSVKLWQARLALAHRVARAVV